MSVTTEKTVRELALENPAATRVFEKLGIDYCCGGNKSLEQACRAANLPLDKVLDSLESADAIRATGPKRSTSGQAKCWPTWLRTSAILITSTRARRLPASVRCSTRSALSTGRTILSCYRFGRAFEGLAQELTMHMMKEERVLFPYIVRMEESVIEKEPVLPPFFGSVQNPVSMMEHEHESAGERIARHA